MMRDYKGSTLAFTGRFEDRCQTHRHRSNLKRNIKSITWNRGTCCWGFFCRFIRVMKWNEIDCMPRGKWTSERETKRKKSSKRI